ncbi:MAG: HNH endonuclease [Verrucomicrobiae bacterium]|nr:HNH endonuclease [Verrucomicrobiae bacterium]
MNPENKICTKCGVEKSLDCFHKDNRKKLGVVAACKDCVSMYAAIHYEKNKKKYRKMRLEYYEANKEKLLDSQKKYYGANKEKKDKSVKAWKEKNPEKVAEIKKRFLEKNPGYGIESTKKWKKENPDKVREAKRKQYNRYKKDPGFRVSGSISNGIRYSLGKGGKANSHWEDLVGFTATQLINHLERQFDENMTWGNYGSYWHIDHKKPIAAFSFKSPFDKEFKECWSLSNLQPLEAKENMRKGARYDV